MENAPVKALKKNVVLLSVAVMLLVQLLFVNCFAADEQTNVQELLPAGTPVSIFKIGDINEDGKINSTDYSLLKKYILGEIERFPNFHRGKIAADTDGNGNINSSDYQHLKRYILGISDKFPKKDIEYLLGDVNGDGSFNALDSALIKREVMASSPVEIRMTDREFLSADIKRDGLITPEDSGTGGIITVE